MYNRLTWPKKMAEFLSDTGCEVILIDNNSTYMPLLDACPQVNETLLFTIENQSNADDCFALQIKFSTTQDYEIYCSKYELEFDNALFLKFQNNFGVFKTELTQIITS